MAHGRMTSRLSQIIVIYYGTISELVNAAFPFCTDANNIRPCMGPLAIVLAFQISLHPAPTSLFFFVGAAAENDRSIFAFGHAGELSKLTNWNNFAQIFSPDLCPSF